MFAGVDLRKLADLRARERAVLSLYLSGPDALERLEKRFRKIRSSFPDGPVGRDERTHFDRNLEAVKRHLERNPHRSGGLCLISCWANDFLQAIPVPASTPDLVWVDSSPYIRPLAELQDEYENVAVVVADNRSARIFLISSAVAGSDIEVEGNVKNHVKKGGWSQKRYQRRRDKELKHYAREIVDVLQRLDREEHFRRIILVGAKEILRIIEENLPPALEKKLVGRKAVHLGAGEKALHEDIWELFFEEERLSEKNLWEAIEGEVLRGGLGVVGIEDVLSAAREGRIEKAVVTRTFQPKGVRCRECDRMTPTEAAACEGCGSRSVYPVGVVNEIVELLKRTGAQVDFVDPLPSLTEAGDIAALLRY